MVEKRTFFVCALCISATLAGCTTPDFLPFSGKQPIEKSGPKVEALVQNMNCELLKAKQGLDANNAIGPKLTLQDWLSHIDYVATAQFTLQVTNQQNLMPSIDRIYPYSKPSTNFTLALSGQFSEQEDRNLVVNATVDFENLHGAKVTDAACGSGTELGGDLQLGEIIALGIAAANSNPSAADVLASDTSGPIVNYNPYQLGVFGTTTDFTITEGLAGSPNLTLVHFTGYGGSQNLFGGTRTVKDTLLISFIPACREVDINPNDTFPWPVWASALIKCTGPDEKNPTYVTAGKLSKLRAINAGASNNLNQLLRTISPSLVQ